VPLLQTESRDQAVDGFAYRVAFPSQHLTISGSGCGQLNTARTEYVESQQSSFHLSKVSIVASALQDLAKNQID